jgi:tetratricopeptide (TPR) repeat protein
MVTRMFRVVPTLGALVLAGCAVAVSGSADNLARLEQARTANPASEPAIRSLGIAYFKANRLAGAREELQQAARMDPQDGVAALYLGLAAEAENDLPAARSAYESYLNVGKTAKVRAQISDRLEVLALREVQADAKRALADEAALSSEAPSPNTVAVLPFSFAGADSSLRPLERGFAELVATDLSRSSQLTIVERARIQALLDEMALQRRTGVDSGTGVRAGRILRASKMVGGSLTQTGDQLRASAIVTDVSTTRVEDPATDAGSMDELFALEKNVVLGLFNSLGITLTTAERNAIEQRPTRSLAAFLAYSRGLEANDAGRYDDARRDFDDAARIDPSFTPARDKSRAASRVSAGTRVNAGSVESGLRGTSEGAAVSAAAPGNVGGGLSNAAVAAAEGVNPSPAAGATAGAISTAGQPQRDPSSGTGGDNPGVKTGTVTIVIHHPEHPERH